MKKHKMMLTWMVTVLLSLTLPWITFPLNAAFTSHDNGSTVKNRKDFVVSVQIGNFDSTAHHWVAIASVTGHNSTWSRVLELYRGSRGNRGSTAAFEMKALISQWNIHKFWPKFYVPKSPYEGHVFDDGINPMQGLEPQPMVLLIIKVDDRLHEYFKKWFRQAPQKGFPGIPCKMLSRGMILARCEIFFP